MKHNDNDAEATKLGPYIRRVREQRGISARHLAHAVHMDPVYITRLENGGWKRPSPEKLQRIASFLEINYDTLFDLAGYRIPEQLPSLVPYLRAKYDMSEDDLQRVSNYFARLRRRHHIVEKQPPQTAHDTDNGMVSWTEL